jgi:hypothetical protein
VAIERGRPVRVATDRRGVTGGAVMTALGPWRTSGHWWTDPPFLPDPPSWDRDEWDVAAADGGVYRIFRDRDTDRWFVDAIVD